MALQQLKQDLNFVTGFKEFIKAYQQVTLMDMEKIREVVLKTRQHMDGLQDVFVDVKNSYEKKIEALNKRKTHLRQDFGGQATIFFSVSTKFSAELNNKVFTHLKNKINDKTNLFVLGQVGEEIIKRHFPRRAYTLIELPRNNQPGNFTEVLQKLIAYDSVDVFFPRFQNVMAQEVITSNLSGEESFILESQKIERKTKRNFLFEPELEKILEFFKGEVFKYLFAKSIEESRLAHLGARITVLEQSRRFSDELEKKARFTLLKARKMLANKKQRNRLAGLYLWQT